MRKASNLLSSCAYLLVLATLILPLQSAAEPFAQRFEKIKKSASPSELYRLLFDLPKGGDLHHHMSMSIPADSWLAIASDPQRLKGNRFYTRLRFANCVEERPPYILFRTIQESSFRKLSPCQQSEYAPLDGLSAAQRAQWLSALKIDQPDEGRDEFFDVLGVRLGELSRDPDLATEMLVENLRQYAAEKVRYLEIQVVGPRFIDRQGVALSTEQAVRILRDRLQRTDAKATGVTVRFLATIVRFQPDAEQQFEKAYALVAQNRDLFVGVNIAGREEIPSGNGLRFVETLRKLRRHYPDIALSMHAGESDAPGREVRTALLLGASRIGHAVNLITDPDTLLLMRNSQYLIEINLLSNLLLGYVPNLASHPFPEYLRIGIPVCLNTDDRTAWDSNLTDEYFAAVTSFNLSYSELVELGENSLSHAFADVETRANLRRAYRAAMTNFEATYSGDDWQDRLRRISPKISGYATNHWKVH